MKKKAILGYPYAGAFYWLAAKENPHSYHKESTRYTGKHPYYKTLYGNHEQEVINNCISLSLLFDDIYIVGADAYLPNVDFDRNKEIVSNDDLNLKVFWDWDKMSEFRINEDEVRKYLKDNIIKNILSNVPLDSCRMILEQVLIQNYISEKFDTTIIGSSGHLTLSKRLYELHDTEKLINKPVNIDNYLSGLNDMYNTPIN